MVFRFGRRRAAPAIVPQRQNRKVSAMVRPLIISPVFEEPAPDQSLAAHHVNNEDLLVFSSVEDSTRRNDQLSIWHSWEFGRAGAKAGKSSQGINLLENSSDECACCFGFVQCDVVSNGVQVMKSGFRPDQFNHRFILLAACSCEHDRPSWIAFSPRAIPSKMRILSWRCSNVWTSTRYAAGRPCSVMRMGSFSSSRVERMRVACLLRVVTNSVFISDTIVSLCPVVK